ncbi:GNAT family N-acetyltransferase [Flaviaesturariibacter flavus]|uniref:GNAT family N-acetyltransferase n=1 Tax=Flaviaesturariibacter flavus TaxID=2502780 RepID=A0A4R1BK75_9BACT|nr:GNAT family N-acetyltransferase [Flaviaesturariibacter flavus]TCJ17724.1 GNAT family N-acetyltransferase [Flaviaesturariibacter flavus]
MLLQHVYIDTYGLEGVSPEFANFMSTRFSVERINFLIAAAVLTVATFRENLIGAAEIVRPARCPLNRLSGTESSKLYVLERFCGQGVGYALLRCVEALAAADGDPQLWLEVWSRNPRAVAFYERQGYRALGTVPFRMEVNCYENLVLAKAL